MSRALCIFGEVLFDHFPDGQRVLGGAPFNVAWNLQALGQDVHFISRVGSDEEGAQVREAMRNWGMDLAGLQTDPQLPTGRVSIQLEDGEPSYDIVAPCAYDRIQAPDALSPCGILYHGTLALRDPVCREALEKLMAREPGLVFVDVNLRPPWWGRDAVLAWLERADWVKLNAPELAMLGGSDQASRGDAAAFLRTHGLEGLIVTHGAAGAELLTRGGQRLSVSPGQSGRMVDAVGAGDAFASVILLGLASGWPLQLSLERAQTFASAMVEQRGATVTDPAYYRQFMDNWQ